MRRTLLLLLAAASILLADRYALVSVTPLNRTELNRLAGTGCEIVQVYDDGSVDCVVNQNEYTALLSAGIPFTTRIDDLERFYSRRYDGRSMGGYLTWDELSDWMVDLHDTYPDITSAPTSIGNTYEGRPQTVVKISSNNDFWFDDPSLPNVWYDGLIHAREPASMRNTRFFMLWLCDNYGGNGFCGLQATWLLDNREIWCLPCNNVDGYVYNEQQSPGGGGMHRKNMNWSAGGDGIDLNRNWTIGWGGAGSSGDPGSQTYRGTAPLSEPETDNVDAFWQDHPPAQMHSTHAYGNILIYPWGYKDDPPTHVTAYETQAELMAQWGTGDLWGQSSHILYYSSGNTRDHAYGLYGAMSWNHETGADFAGFWPSPEETVKLTRRNLRSYLLTAFMAGCPYDPHVPGTPVIDDIGAVTTPFTINWNSVPEAGSYALQELSGYQVVLDDDGSGGPFTMNNWSTTTSQYHSSPSSYLSGGTGNMTWTGTVAIPENGGGRLSFWSYYNIPNGSCLGSVEVSTDGGENWFYLQTFTRNDPAWRINIHELDEWQGDTLSFRWATQGSSSDLYIDDIMLEVWEENEFLDLNVPSNSYTVSTHESGEFWFRVVAMDPDFGPGWPSDAAEAQITGTGIAQGEEPSGTTGMGRFSPNPAVELAVIPVSVSATDLGGVTLAIYDLSGRCVADLSGQLSRPGAQSVQWNCRDNSGSRIPGGLYFAVMDAPGVRLSRELIVIGGHD
ncbi:MAG: M14 family metallopeptidase [Candidatus Aegiribacteria sp.]